MPIPKITSSLNAGEISPSLFGRTDLDKYGKGTSTCRNMFASYRGGVQSRAGTKFVGQCKQASTLAPPVLIPFQFSVTEGIVLELGELYMRFTIAGAYVTEAPVAITGITQANPGIVSVVNTWSNGDWVYVSGVLGMLQVDGRIFVVGSRTGGTIHLVDPITNVAIDTSAYDAYVSGGTAARIYTLATPYATADLAAIKWAQSADVMTLTHPSYPPYDLTRLTNSSWTLVKTDFGSSAIIAAPASMTASTTTTSTTSVTYYQYGATAVDAVTGEESVISPIAVLASDNIGIVAGTISMECGSVTGAGSYNFYRGPISYTNPPQQGAIFGYLGTALGPSFQDSNILPDYSVSPPIHNNPFATSSIASVNMTNQGSGYNTTSTAVSITGPGSGFVGVPIVVGGAIVWVATKTGGEGYTSSDTVNFSGGGTGAVATITVGLATGTYPSVVSYFQQRRIYANTTNQPDTYFASKPGAFLNFDSSIPVRDDDAIIGSPWSQQVNGIQWMINMPGGLVLLTGLGAWQLNGGGGTANAALTPASQVATPQAYNGVSPIVRPITINYDILYVQEKGSIVRDLSYNFFVNIYTGTDMTVLSNHLFDNHTITRWDWSEEPFKLIWAVRDDGVLLCMTYLKEQDVYAWTRHDTNGLFQSVCSVSEPPVNATYFVVRRLIQSSGTPVYAYFQERMDDRLWQNVEDCWCVDAGLTYSHNEPSATLAFSSATGVPTLAQPDLLWGGENYSAATYARIDDPTGTGAVPAITVTAGVITAASVGGTLTGYTNPTFVVVDPANEGGGAQISMLVNYVAEVAAAPGVFSNAPGLGQVDDVVRGGGGVAVVSAYNSSTSLTVHMMRPVTEIIPNDPYSTPVPQLAGDWSIINPISTIYGLNYLEGMTVSILADGIPVTPQVVTDGSIVLDEPASAITIGLGYAVQLQTLYFDMQAQATVQGRRKYIPNMVTRLEASGGPFQAGTNQPDASTQPDGADVPWTNMGDVQLPFSSLSPLQPFDLFTGDVFENLFNQLGSDKGQVAFQQLLPIPLNLLAVICWTEVGDQPGQ